MHLLSDMSVPSHILNDVHHLLPLADVSYEKYEEYAKNNYLIYGNISRDLSSELVIEGDDLLNPFSWDTFPDHIKMGPYRTKVIEPTFS